MTHMSAYMQEHMSSLSASRFFAFTVAWLWKYHFHLITVSLFKGGDLLKTLQVKLEKSMTEWSIVFYFNPHPTSHAVFREPGHLLQVGPGSLVSFLKIRIFLPLKRQNCIQHPSLYKPKETRGLLCFLAQI